MDTLDIELLHGFLSRYRHVVLSTASRSGIPESAVVGVAVLPDCSLLFDTTKSSRKYVHLSENPEVAFVFGGWDGAVTVQYEGAAEELAGDALARHKATYLEAFPDGKTRESWPDITYFLVKPRWVRYSDFTQSPPGVQEHHF